MAALKKLEVAIDKAELLSRAAANPADPAIATLAARMTANGGEKEVDDLVQFAEDDRPADDRGARHRTLRRDDGAPIPPPPPHRTRRRT